MEDDTKLKIVFFAIVALYTGVAIGVWEVIIKPLFWLLSTYAWPVLLAFYHYLFG